MPNDVQFTKREIIEDKLLTALTEEGKVAILLTKPELTMLIEMVTMCPWKDEKEKHLIDDLRSLREAAFP